MLLRHHISHINIQLGKVKQHQIDANSSKETRLVVLHWWLIPFNRNMGEEASVYHWASEILRVLRMMRKSLIWQYNWNCANCYYYLKNTVPNLKCTNIMVDKIIWQILLWKQYFPMVYTGICKGGLTLIDLWQII